MAYHGIWKHFSQSLVIGLIPSICQNYVAHIQAKDYAINDYSKSASLYLYINTIDSASGCILPTKGEQL